MGPQPSPRAVATPLLAALAGAALILLLQAVPAALPLLEYRRDLLATEPWRLFTGHLVHLNWTHAAVNASAWLLLAWLAAPQVGAKRQLACLALGAASVSLGLAAFHPAIGWYRGASGMLHALFFADAAAAAGASMRSRPPRGATLALALLAGGWVKVLVEQPGAGATPYAEWLGATTVPQAHLLGAVAGTALGLVLAMRSR
jgi:rhomboid family GlyGly-CTERM serine protease